MLYLIPVFTLGSGLFFPLGVLLYWFTSNTWTMLQQLYINKYHPHTPKEQPEVGAVGRTLRPQAGQRPVRDPRGKGVDVTKPGRTVAREPEPEPAEAPVRSSTPRPGQRPNRPGGGGKRPPGKKKRR
jgi:YidC/Oxa1 family membrane protein insertase